MALTSAGISGEDESLAKLTTLGLSPNEARIYLALLQIPVATAAQVADIGRVPRPKAYAALTSLVNKGMCVALDGNVARFRAVEPDSALSALLSRNDHSRELVRDREVRLIADLKESLPESSIAASRGSSYVESVTGRAETTAILERMIGEASKTLLMVQQPPYLQAPSRWTVGEREALGRGVVVRVIYSEEALSDPRRFRPLLEAGAATRLLERPAMKLAVRDGKEALLGLRDPVTGYHGETSALIRHSDLVEAIELLFEKEWGRASEIK